MTLRAAIIDLDGTVYHGDSLIPGAAEAIGSLREDGLEILFLTNNAEKTRQQYVDTLTGMGLSIEPEQLLASGYLTARYLDDRGIERVHVTGTDGLCTEMREQGLSVTGPDQAEAYVVANYPDLDYPHLQELLRGFDDDLLVGTNPDPTLPGTDGPRPGAGTIIAAVERMLGQEAKVIGKPSHHVTEIATDMLGLPPEDCMVIGDRIETDMAMAEDAGMTSVLVMTGSTDQDALDDSDIAPDHVLRSISDIRDVMDQDR